MCHLRYALTTLPAQSVHSISDVTAQVYGRQGKPFDEKALMGHHFFVIRAIGGAGGNGARGEEIQDRLTKEFFETVEDFDA